MGNQPSAPPPPQATPSQVSIPPLPPPCDLECQKDKQLALLKTALDNTDPITDPPGYEKARIAYYTLLNGQSWLNTEKSRIASEEVQPVLKDFSTKYDALKGEQKSQKMFSKMASSLKAQEAADKSSNDFLKKQMTLEKDKANVSDRLNELNSSGSSYIPVAIDIVILLLGISVCYSIYKKLGVTSPTIT
jgi:hypothetical protein